MRETNGPRLIRVGHQVFNLSQLLQAGFFPVEEGQRPKPLLYLEFAGQEGEHSYRLDGEQALVTWRFLERHSEAVWWDRQAEGGTHAQ
jgi:hypothetical protein